MRGTFSGRMMRAGLLAAIATALLPRMAASQVSSGAIAARAGKHAMTIDDLFIAEQLGDVALAPDGASAAVVVQRPMGPRENPAWTFLLGNGRADVWLVSTDGRHRRRITDGRRDGAGYWMPLWSPDGERLAMLSTRGGDNVHLLVWDRTTDSIRTLSGDGVDLLAETRSEVTGMWYPAAWVDDTTLLCAFMSGGDRSRLLDPDVHMQRTAPALWRAQATGTTATASVLRSGTAASLPAGADSTPSESTQRGYVALVDARTGRMTSLADYPVIGETRRFALSHDRSTAGGRLAIGVAVALREPQAGVTMSNESWARTRLGFVRLAAPGRVHWIDTVEVVQGLFQSPLHWSSDDSRLAVVGRFAGESGDSARVLVLTPSTGAAVEISPPRLVAEEVSWVDPASLLVRASVRGKCERSSVRAACDRRGWWLFDARGRMPARQVGTSLASGLEEAMPSGRAGELLAVAGGALWRLRDGRATRLLGSVRDSVTGIAWLSHSGMPAGHPGRVIVFATAGGKRALVRVDVGASGGAPARLPTPDSPVRVVGYDVRSERLLVASAGELGFPLAQDGPDLWAIEQGRSPTTLIALNEQLADVIDAPRRLVRYRGLDGDSLTALLILPIGYEAGRRYPLVAWVYPGTMITDTLFIDVNKNLAEAPQFNLQLLAARGYAVLVPSIPVRGPGRVDGFLDIPKGVLPALDCVVELGVADENRLAVMGHSMGGYAALGLIGFTHRFRAAIAAAGPVDLVSEYGTFDRRFAYDHDADKRMNGAHLLEFGLMLRVGVPWKDHWRYRLNSPLSYVERVQTPVMIVQGDADYVPIMQGEEFYSALRRLGKTAEFVRYWGEGHILYSPANIRDWWSRVFGFLDHYLAEPRQAQRASSN
ncbi:MAG TPA: prolyl oligopeptidase family serine peptidase [Gemmatimonadaceae bacterium]